MPINSCRFYVSFVAFLSIAAPLQPIVTLATAASTGPEPCENTDAPQLKSPPGQFSQVFNWIVNPEIVLANVIDTVGYQMMVQANNRPSPWPTIHEGAKLARVPVIMYHDILPKKKVSFDVNIQKF